MKLLLFNQNQFLAFLVIVLGLSLTISTVDTLINAISSSIIVDGRFFHKLKVSKSLNYSKYLIVIMSLLVFFISSRGYSVLYLFLLADLLCCCFVFIFSTLQISINQNYDLFIFKKIK